jgi:hypothetical protein
MSEQWFSTKIRLACLIVPKGLHSYMDSIFIFRCAGFEEAFLRALEIGKSRESRYMNSDQQLVEWKLKEIISLDIISSESLESGTEVYSEPVEPLPSEQTLSYGEFHPENSKPTQTI